jgi:hypothetical protein
MTWDQRLILSFEGAIAFATMLYVVVALLQRSTMNEQLAAMLSANRQNGESFIASQRPYVSVGKADGTIGEFDTVNGDEAGLLLYFHNGGNLPALRFNLQGFNHSGVDTERHMARLREVGGKHRGAYIGGVQTIAHRPDVPADFSVASVMICGYTYPVVAPNPLPFPVEYVPPCEQPDEKKRHEEQDKKALLKHRPLSMPAWTPSKAKP